MERVARLLTRLPICTTTGMKHPVTPSGIVKRMTSQAAIPSEAGKLGSSPSQHRPRPAETTVAGLTDPDIDLDRRGRNVGDAVLRFVTRDRAQTRAVDHDVLS